MTHDQVLSGMNAVTGFLEAQYPSSHNVQFMSYDTRCALLITLDTELSEPELRKAAARLMVDMQRARLNNAPTSLSASTTFVIHEGQRYDANIGQIIMYCQWPAPVDPVVAETFAPLKDLSTEAMNSVHEALGALPSNRYNIPNVNTKHTPYVPEDLRDKPLDEQIKAIFENPDA